MPVRLIVEPEAPPVVVEPSPTPAPPPPAREYIEWTPAGGPTLVLSDHVQSGIMLGGIDDDARAVIGLDMPPQETFDTELPGGGQLANGRRWAARLFALPVVIHADALGGEDGLQQYRRELIASFNPARGDGVLTIAYPDGERRYLDAAYQAGLDVAERGRAGFPYSDSFTIEMKARDPFAYGDEQTISFAPANAVEFYAPADDTENVFYISDASTTGDVVVLIDGQVKVRPVWTLHGPITTATLRNRDTGQKLELAANLVGGETLVVRTDPRTPPYEKITKDGVTAWEEVADDFPVFWGLEPGSNRITVQLNGTTPGQSSAELAYRPRYLTA